MSRQQALSSMICRQYPPRRDALWNPGIYAYAAARALHYGRLWGERRKPSQVGDAPKLWHRIYRNDDVRHFATTFSLGFTGILIFFG